MDRRCTSSFVARPRVKDPLETYWAVGGWQDAFHMGTAKLIIGSSRWPR